MHQFTPKGEASSRESSHKSSWKTYLGIGMLALGGGMLMSHCENHPLFGRIGSNPNPSTPANTDAILFTDPEQLDTGSIVDCVLYDGFPGDASVQSIRSAIQDVCIEKVEGAGTSADTETLDYLTDLTIEALRPNA